VWVRDLVYVSGGCVDWGYSRDHAIRKICPSLHIAKSKAGLIIVTLLYSNTKYLYLCAKMLLCCFINHHYLLKYKLFIHLSLLLVTTRSHLHKPLPNPIKQPTYVCVTT
jgi:hypothetical protein